MRDQAQTVVVGAGIVGTSAAMDALRRLIRKVDRTNYATTVTYDASGQIDYVADIRLTGWLRLAQPFAGRVVRWRCEAAVGIPRSVEKRNTELFSNGFVERRIQNAGWQGRRFFYDRRPGIV